MSLALMSLILLGGLILLLALGVEIAPAMGIVAGLGLIFLSGSRWIILHGLPLKS